MPPQILRSGATHQSLSCIRAPHQRVFVDGYQRFAVVDRPAVRKRERIFEFHLSDVKKLSVVEMRAHASESRRKIDVQHFVRIGRRGINGREQLDPVGFKPRLLFQLSLGADARVFARSRLPAGISIVFFP